LTNPARAPSLDSTRLSRVPCPSALAEAGSYWPRGCLTRVRRVCRVSHPLDAFPSHDLSTLFQIDNAPGLRPSKVSPSTARFRPHRPALPAWRWLRRSRELSRSGDLAHLPGFVLRGSPSLSRCGYTGSARSSLGLLPPPGVSSGRDGAGLSEHHPPLNFPGTRRVNRRSSPVLRSLDRHRLWKSPKRSPPLLGFRASSR
jgi:hypothetical protein